MSKDRTHILKVVLLEDLTPHWNDAHWQAQCPTPGTVVYSSTHCSLDLARLDNTPVQVELPEMLMHFTALILADQPFHARVCEPNLARHATCIFAPTVST